MGKLGFLKRLDWWFGGKMEEELVLEAEGYNINEPEEEVDLSIAMVEYDQAVMEQEAKRARLIRVANKLKDTNSKARKVLGQLTGTLFKY